MNQRDPILSSVCEYIQSNIQNKITMSDLEQHTELSARALQFKFKKHLNKSPFQYIEEKKLLKAHELIQEYRRSKTISEITQLLKFSHKGRFSMSFKKRFGVHPSTFAKSNTI